MSKGYVNELKDKGLIEGNYLQNIPKGYLIKTNRVSIGYQEGIRGYQLDTLDTLLTPYFDILFQHYGKDVLDETRKRWVEFNTFFGVFSQQLTPSNLTPSILLPNKEVKNEASELKKLSDSVLLPCSRCGTTELPCKWEDKQGNLFCDVCKEVLTLEELEGKEGRA